MLRTDAELKNSQRILADSVLARQQLVEALLPEEIPEVTKDFMIADHDYFIDHIQYEVDEYERLRSGGLKAIPKDWPVGRQLIAARIALKLTQRELARRLGVDESQVSRDERNDYHGITTERAARIREAMGIEAQITYRMASAPSPLLDAIKASKSGIAAKRPKGVKSVPKAASPRKGIDKQS